VLLFCACSRSVLTSLSAEECLCVYVSGEWFVGMGCCCTYFYFLFLLRMNGFFRFESDFL